MAKSIAGILVAVMAFAAMALADSAGTGLAQAQTNPSNDRGSLGALYNASDGPNWRTDTNWLSDAPLDEWYGVKADSTGQVTTLQLDRNHLSGEIPEELGNLIKLKTLDLSDNQLRGEIPADLAKLTSLELLDLGGNQQLTGEIPPELGSLSSLEWLDLSFNQLSGEIPAELGSLTNLEWLGLYVNQLSGEIPAELGSLSSLEWLDLSFNQLSGEIPAELGNLTKLETLRLYDNQLGGEIPAELVRLPNLEWLGLYGNQLSGEIPAELGSLANLRLLDLSSNQLGGEIPAELGSLAFLGWMSLSRNQLTGEIPPELGNLANLEILDFSYNQLTGEIPPELGNLTSLGALDLSYNQLTGEIPPELGSLAFLGWMSLSRNQLTGEIPPELGNLTSLGSLKLSYNQLTGEIPPELGSLAFLEILDLSYNQLSGEIPPELGNLTNLRWLVLSINDLTGCIPDGLRNATLVRPVPVLGFCPGAPKELTAVASGTGAAVNLSWTAPAFTGASHITGYRIQASPDGNDPWTDVPTSILGNVTAYTDDGGDEDGPRFAAGEWLRYRVAAVNAAGTGRPSNVAIATPDACRDPLGLLTAPVTKTGVWAGDCASEARSGSYARYYSFTLDQAGQVEINLTSSADPYLVLRQGEGRDGTIEDSNDNVGSRNFNSSINWKLDPGAYTVEATTYFAGQAGGFTLSVRPLQETEDLGDLTRSVDRSNSAWTSNHESTQQMGSYARSYTFTLYAATHVVINLTSPEDPYLFLLDTNGAVVHENDNVTTRNLNSRIDETLPAGTYTIEATTYFPGRTGTFHLSIGYFGATGG